MPESLSPLKSKNQTGRAMHTLVRRFYDDLDDIYVKRGNSHYPLSSLDMGEFHEYVRNIPYRRDDAPIEIVARPSRIVTSGYADCKKKGILMGSWAKYHRVPYRFLALSTRPDRQAHHVAPQYKLGGEWVNVDATYSNQRIGQLKHVTNAEILGA